MDRQNLFRHVEAGKRLEKCLFGHQEVALPELFIEQGAVFREIMSQETWSTELTEDQQHYLKKFLPSFHKNDEDEKQETLKKVFTKSANRWLCVLPSADWRETVHDHIQRGIQMLFSGDNFKFGNPLKQFQMKLREGFYAPDIAKYSSLCAKGKKREYKIRQQRYYAKVLQDILIARQSILEDVRHLPPDEPPKFTYTPPPRDNSMENRVKKKYTKILKEVREECMVEDTSSEEDLPNDKAPLSRSKKGAAKNLYPIPSPEHPPPSVVSTFAPKPLTNGESASQHPGNDPAAKSKVKTICPTEITEDDYLHMLRNHKRRRTEFFDSPDMDVQDISLQDIMIRCQAIRRIPAKSALSPSQTSSVSKKRLKAREKPDHRRIKKEKLIKEEKQDEDMNSGKSSLRFDEDSGSQDHTKLLGTSRDEDDDSVSDFPSQESSGSHLTYGQHSNFFSLLRNLIIEFDDAKATTAKMEEKVREWLECSTSSSNTWFSEQSNWVDAVVSALKFLSGDALGLDLENFIPFLDYKERAQQWKWIGASRDADEELLPLFKHWLDNKGDNSFDLFDSSQGSPPPNRIKTDFVVRPTTQEEKDIFKEQEARRFETPHKAFTYILHGYESVVGPVKGVYSKENAMNKAREHTLLVSDRPSYVTILTLVRDAAARLPNGEGTRGDICELLKDSGFIAPGVTDAQINTVVSGALDRLHYEKDPCVKYEVNRKLWVYLHRNRTEEEFEKIHQAQGAAVKAKKSLQKPKSSRAKAKDSTVVSSASQNSTSSVKMSSNNSVLSETSTTMSVPSSSATENTATPTTKTNSSPRAQSAKQSPKTTQSSRRSSSVSGTPPAKTVSGLLQSSQSGTASPIVDSLLMGSPHVLTTQAVTQLGKVTTTSAGGGKPVTISFMQPGATGGLPIMTQVKTGKPGSAQPLSFNLLQAATLSGKITTVAGLTTNSNSVLISKPDSTMRLQKGQMVSSSAVTLGKSVSSSITPSMPSGKGISVTHPAVSTSPVVARLVQQVSQSQIMSVGNLLQGTVQKVGGRASGPTTFKIQGGNIVHPVGGGKPIHLSGKPLSTTKGLVQISGKPGQQTLGLVQTPQGSLSTLNIISPGLRPGMSLVTRADSKGTFSSTDASTLLSSALQSGNLLSQAKTGAAMLHSHNLQAISQPKVVSSPQSGIVVTQLAPGSLSLRPGLQSLSQAKLMSQGGMLPTQFIVQQAGLKTTEVLTTTSVTQGAGIGTPIIVSAPGGKAGHNIQLVKTMLGQHAGLKAGQATILISQPNMPQCISSTISPSAQLLQAATKASKSSPKGKSQPVYARIITPPPGMRLANVSAAGQTLSAPGVSVLQTVGKLPSGTVVTATNQTCITKVTDSTANKPH